MHTNSKFHCGLPVPVRVWSVVCGLFLIGLFVAGSPCLAEEEPATGVEFMEERLKEKISLDYKDTDLNSVLRSIAWTYGLNLVTSPDVKGKVTISLQDVTIEEALDAILTINGLAYTRRKNIIFIAPGDPRMVEIKSEVIFLKYIAAGEAQNLLRKILSPKGDMKINELANSLIVTDFPGNIAKLKELLKKIDLAPIQVLIEAKIVDITSTDLRAMGVKWDADYSPGHGIFDRSTKYSERLKGTIDMAEQSGSLSGGQLSLNTLTLKNLTVTATIDALVKDGKAHLLANPSIAVLNGQEARIIIGERYPYKERTQTATGTTETTKFVDIGTTLRVTPQVNKDGYITMRVHPEVSSLYASLDAGPRITTREADTTVRVKEGETLVIGGLIKQKDNRSREKIPILGDIPIIGFLFSRSERDMEQKELAVFITPRILRSKEEMELLSKKEVAKEKVYVTLDKTAHLSIVARLFEKAHKLDKGYGVESRRKDKQFRKTQSLSLFEHIFTEFPDSEKAPEAKFRAGMIYYKYLKDYQKVKEVFSRLISDYPESSFATKAERCLREIEHKKRKELKRRPKPGLKPTWKIKE